MENVLVVYDCAAGKFRYPMGTGEEFVEKSDKHPLWEVMEEDGFASRSTAKRFKDKIQEIAQAETPQVQFEEFFIKKTDHVWKWYMVGFVCAEPGKSINITFTDIDRQLTGGRKYTRNTEKDELTGLLTRNAFCKIVRSIMEDNEEDVVDGEYALVYLDIIRFKAVNDIWGMEAGDRLLNYIADAILQSVKSDDVICRTDSDRFVFFTHSSGKELEACVEHILDMVTHYALPMEISCNAGIYIPGKELLPVDLMIDRAILAHSTIKGSYTERYAYYDEKLRENMLGEQEIAGMMTTALAERQFVIYYQPQYNHSTGMLVGAEALVRWKHPERGLISPGNFIPIFEKNGFIKKLDLYVFEETCRFLRKCIDKNLPVVPISSNFSRQDIFQMDFVQKLEEIRRKYDVPAKYLRVEITETTVVGNSEYVNDMVRKLHEYGYIVEMDDFGSGYSSLNVLKDIELDIIKLDMLFISEDTGKNKRGGTILSSVVRMAKWLGMPVIAEGVETIEQADFLRSIGCEYIQGYLYSKPLPEENYEALLSKNEIGVMIPEMDLIANMNARNFWDPTSMETLIFNNYVGGAAIFSYSDGKIEILRVNEKYLRELCMNLSEKEIIESDLMEMLDEENRHIFLDTIMRAIETGDEQECETWRELSSSCCGDERICIQSNIRMIGKSQNNWLFYAMIRNVTREKQKYTDILDSERRFKMASEQVNIYYWEYTVATREMRPCFRCMRDLGLPPLLMNYPDSAIERGIFPPEVADMYRDWHRQVAEGVPELEAVIPLTMDRVPFRVRYTTEFDEHGRAVKAYGSAALIVEAE